MIAKSKENIVVDKVDSKKSIVEIAWFYCIVNDYNKWKKQPSSQVNIKWADVFFEKIMNGK